MKLVDSVRPTMTSSGDPAMDRSASASRGSGVKPGAGNSAAPRRLGSRAARRLDTGWSAPTAPATQPTPVSRDVPDQPECAARPQHAVELGERPSVRREPVERGRADHGIDAAVGER